MNTVTFRRKKTSVEEEDRTTKECAYLQEPESLECEEKAKNAYRHAVCIRLDSAAEAFNCTP